MSRAIRFTRRYANRLRLLAVTALVVIVVDHAAKFLVAAIEPGTYVLNPGADPVWWLPMVTASMVSLLPYRPLMFAAGVALGGGGSNVIDHHFWPGGIPDFIYTGWPNGYWNLGDLFLWAGSAAFFLALLVWPFQGTAR